MKLLHTNQIELSYANAKALIQAFEAHGEQAMLYRVDAEHGVLGVSIVTDEAHYTPEELADRTSPYLPPEAWAGVR